MKRTLWLTPIMICGLFLLACSAVAPAAETAERQASKTAVATPIPPTETLTTLPPTMTARPPATETATSTPPPTNLPPTNAPTPQYTATPTPRPTQIPLPTPTQPMPENVQQVAAGETLPINHDLLFISEGELRLWQPQTGQVQTLLASASGLAIAGWRITPDKQRMLIAQTYGADLPGFTLSIFDANARELHEIWSEVDSYLFAYELAADGRTTAIITSTSSLNEDGGQETVTIIDNEQKQAATLASCPNRYQKSLQTHDVDYIRRCQHVVSVPHSETWLWRDIEGVWQGGPNMAPRLLVMHDFFDDQDLPLFFQPTRDWSPNGRYQLLSAHRFEGGNRWLLDMETGQTIMVENSGFGIHPGPVWQWTQDNRLLTVLPPNSGAEVLVELWHIEGLQLVQDTTLVLPNPNAAAVVNLSQLPDGRFALIINGAGPDLGAIMLMPNFNTPPQLLTTLPPLEHWGYGYDQSLTWTPDAAGAIYLYPYSQELRPFYLPAAGTILYELTELLGNHISELVWLP